MRSTETKLELVKTDKQIINIAMQTGFENLRTFNRLFREFEGVTPKEFRQQGEKLKVSE